MKEYFEQKKLEAKIWALITLDNLKETKKDISRILAEDWLEKSEKKQIFILNIIIQEGWKISWQKLYEKSEFSKVHLTFILNQLLKQWLIEIVYTWNRINQVRLVWKNKKIKNFKKDKKFSTAIFPI